MKNLFLRTDHPAKDLLKKTEARIQHLVPGIEEKMRQKEELHDKIVEKNIREALLRNEERLMR